MRHCRMIVAHAFGPRELDLHTSRRCIADQAERAELIATLASNPLAGDLVPGLGGIRKMRFAAGGQGKRGGFRVIWYVMTQNQPILALLIYGKNEQANPTPDQRRAMVSLVDSMKQATRRDGP